MQRAVAIITRRIEQIDAAIDRLRNGMNTGKEMDAAGTQLNRAQMHREILIDVLREIKGKK